MAHIIIYSTPTCVYCKMTKAFFKEHNVVYTEKDVASDTEARQEMIAKSGQLGVPVLDIGGTIVIGFDKQRIAALAGIT